MIHFPRKHFVFPPVRDPKTREIKRCAVGARPKPKIAAIQSHGNRLEFLQSFVLIRAERFHWFMGNDNVQCTEIDGRMQIINLVMQRPLWTRQRERFNWLTDYSSNFYFATGAHLNSLEFCAVPMIHAVQSIKLQFARCRRSSKTLFPPAPSSRCPEPMGTQQNCTCSMLSHLSSELWHWSWTWLEYQKNRSRRQAVCASWRFASQYWDRRRNRVSYKWRLKTLARVAVKAK